MASYNISVTSNMLMPSWDLMHGARYCAWQATPSRAELEAICSYSMSDDSYPKYHHIVVTRSAAIRSGCADDAAAPLSRWRCAARQTPVCAPRPPGAARPHPGGARDAWIVCPGRHPRHDVHALYRSPSHTPCDMRRQYAKKCQPVPSSCGRPYAYCDIASAWMARVACSWRSASST